MSIYSDKLANRCGVFEKKKTYLKKYFSFGEKLKLNDKTSKYNSILLSTLLLLTYFVDFSSRQKEGRSQESMEEINN